MEDVCILQRLLMGRTHFHHEGRKSATTALLLTALLESAAGQARLLRSEDSLLVPADWSSRSGRGRLAAVVRADGLMAPASPGDQLWPSSISASGEDGNVDTVKADIEGVARHQGAATWRGASLLELSEGATTGAGKRCSMEGGNCTCEGAVSYGVGDNRTFLRVNGTLPCTAFAFGATPAAGNDCVCYDFKWCLADMERDRSLVMDLPHRRRMNLGRKGSQLHQRRRWCGFGPRDCLWGDWGSWGACSGTCSPATRTRVRSQTLAAANGGDCEGGPQGSQQCVDLPRCATSANASSQL